MGTGVSAALVNVGAAPGWYDHGRGLRLRQLFGGYRGQDIWAVLRKLKAMDDGHGFLGFDEVQEVLNLKAPSMLFLWDIFSQQNELVAGKELLTVCCVFSSALLEEKARYLHAVFDASGRGLGTGQEVASICLMVLLVLGKVTGTVAKAKEVTPQLQLELETLLPPYAEAVQQVGSKEAFQKERVIGQLEIDRILTPSIRDAYESLPLHTDPLGETEPPPPAGWAGRASVAPAGAADGGGPRAGDGLQRKQTDSLPPGAEPSERHLAWFQRMDTQSMGSELDNSGDLQDTIHRWLIIQNHEFAAIAKDLPGFRQLFCKGLCSALGLPAHGNCVEVLNVTNGSIIVEFLMRPRAHTDSRSAFELSQLLEKQLSSPYSALRRGPLGKFLGNAFLLSASPQTVNDPELTGIEEEEPEVKLPATVQDAEAQTNTFELGTPRAVVLKGAAASGACTRQEEEEAMEKLREAVRLLQDARQRQKKAKDGERRTVEEIKKRDVLIAQLREELS